MKIFTLILLLFVVFAVSSTQLSAQVIVVKGKVLDKRERPVPGTNILIKKSSRGTVANSDGDFELKMEEGEYTLLISMLGYNSVEQKVVVKKDHEYRLNVVMKKEWSDYQSKAVFEEVKQQKP
jgi:iron complex outermembrane receptor protein